MWADEVTIETHATCMQVWQLWSNPNSWAEWDDDVECAHIDGIFKHGEIGELKPKSAPKSTFTLIEVTESKSFTTRVILPLATMDFVHQLSEKDGALFITHRIEISGALTFLFSRVIGKKWIKALPKTLQTLSTMAQIIK